MAAGKLKLYEKAKGNIANGTIDLDTDTFKAILLSSASNANTLSASEVLADLTNELATANGYTNTGQALGSVTWTQSGGTWTFTSAAVVWTASGAGITARLFAVYANVTRNSKVNPLLGVVLLDTTPADVTATAGNTFTVTPNASGLFTLSGAAVD
jgi:hypothetical protein